VSLLVSRGRKRKGSLFLSPWDQWDIVGRITITQTYNNNSSTHFFLFSIKRITTCTKKTQLIMLQVIRWILSSPSPIFSNTYATSRYTFACDVLGWVAFPYDKKEESIHLQHWFAGKKWFERRKLAMIHFIVISKEGNEITLTSKLSTMDIRYMHKQIEWGKR